MFIDETWAKTNMTRTHSRCAVGHRLVDKMPHGHWKTLTFIAALRCDRITAPCVFDGPINGLSFLAYVTQFLAPTLRAGDIVVIDNLGSHKAARCVERSAQPAPSCSSCRPTVRTSTLSNRSSSRRCCERLRHDPSGRLGRASAGCSRNSARMNVPTTLPTLAMRQRKAIRL